MPSCECDLCDRTFHYVQTLNEHKRRHVNERPYTCYWDDCDKTFVTHSGLEDHVKRHQRKKEKQCPFCPKTFARNYELNVHKSRIHKEEASLLSQRPQSTCADWGGTEETASSQSVLMTEESRDEPAAIDPRSHTSFIREFGPKIEKLQQQAVELEHVRLSAMYAKEEQEKSRQKQTAPKSFAEVASKRVKTFVPLPVDELNKLRSALQICPRKVEECIACGKRWPTQAQLIAHRPCYFRNNPTIDRPDSLFDCSFCYVKPLKGFDALVAHYSEHFDKEDHLAGCNACKSTVII